MATHHGYLSLADYRLAVVARLTDMKRDLATMPEAVKADGLIRQGFAAGNPPRATVDAIATAHDAWARSFVRETMPEATGMLKLATVARICSFYRVDFTVKFEAHTAYAVLLASDPRCSAALQAEGATILCGVGFDGNDQIRLESLS